MPARVDLTGQKFGVLTILELADRRSSSGDVYWVARCECGSERQYRGKGLRCGDAKSCGCKQYQPERLVKDLVGQRFGRLQVLALSRVREELGAYWSCRCDCGHTTEVRANSLTQGKQISCGCHRPVRHTDLAGRRFGALTALRRAGSRPTSRGVDAIWLCACDCGAEKKVLARCLVHGLTKSCRGVVHLAAGGQSMTSAYSATKQQERRARKLKAGGVFTHLEVVALYNRQRGLCAVCRAALPLKKMHRDHVVPLKLGGDNSIRNIQLLCKSCNCSKGARHPVDFMRSRGLLL